METSAEQSKTILEDFRNPANREETVLITDALMQAHRWVGGTFWNYPQLKALGVQIPLKSGWYRRLLGTRVTVSAFEEFKRLGAQKKPKPQPSGPDAAYHQALEICKNRLRAAGVEHISKKGKIVARQLAQQMGLTKPISRAQARDFILLQANLANIPLPRKPAPPPKPFLHRTAIGNIDPSYHPSLKADFYDSLQWKELRVDILRRDGRRCVYCGSTPQTGAVIHVDHIIPISVDWSRRFDPRNLQVLCADCNQGKGNRYSDDWRR